MRVTSSGCGLARLRIPSPTPLPASVPVVRSHSMKLNKLIEDLNELEPDDKLEWLVEFADQLPELSAERLGQPFPESCLVRECQTPVHLWVEAIDGRVHIEADVPRKSPTVRGLVALLVVGLNGEPVSAALALPDDLVSHWKLNDVLGMTRQQGFRGVVARLKRSLRDSSGNQRTNTSRSQEN